MKKVTRNSSSPTESNVVSNKGRNLLYYFLFAISGSLISIWFQYYIEYHLDYLTAKFYGEPFVPPDFYFYFVPMIIALVLISFIPLAAFFFRRSKSRWVLRALGTVMAVSGLATTFIFHVDYGAFALFYLIIGLGIIQEEGRINKQRLSILG